jgi:hypothetical protein
MSRPFYRVRAASAYRRDYNYGQQSGIKESSEANTHLLYEFVTWCLSGHRLPSGQCPCIYALHSGRSGSRPKRYSR